jgi:hypothetical protein
MNPSYFRIRLPYQEATTRFQAWFDRSLQEEPIQTDSVDSVKLACDSDGHWRGPALLIYQTEDWTVFEDLVGGLSSVPATEWLKFAKLDEFFLAGYNDAIPYGELIVINQGLVLREFLNVPGEPAENVNIGHLPQEEFEPIQSWVEVANIIDKDDLPYHGSGWLWIFSYT